MTTITDRVREGMTWLDINVPGWCDRIDVERLDISHCRRCMLGQLFGNYWRNKLSFGECCTMGFTRPFDELRLFPAPTAAWRAAILARRTEVEEPETVTA